jgi:glycosyltransferase involved in cell wall biosynthesis
MTTNVLMLGWEYPPHISGGLGTACQGLTTALAPLDVRIQFVVPTLYGVEEAPHMRLVDPDGISIEPAPAEEQEDEEVLTTVVDAQGDTQTVMQRRSRLTTSEDSKLQTVRVPSTLSPYLSSELYDSWIRALETRTSSETWEEWSRRWLERESATTLPTLRSQQRIPADSHYGQDLFSEVSRYAARVVNWSIRQPRRPDVVHAHDWMTFPAAAQVARAMGVPLVAHVHSLEQDRSGGGANPTIASIEGAGLRSADRVIAVSHYTARQVSELHGVPIDRIDVVHNGVYTTRTVAAYRDDEPQSGPTVLFLGRITFQKGPDYFVEAAARVHSKLASARFVMAGAGDMLPRMRARVAELGLDDVFSFPGFVRGADVERLFSTADVYVMPSVSEPFGISALEAMSYETPVILSRQSGASEILRHALKVDFWDVSRLAAQILAVLTYPELQKSIVNMAREEVRRVHWEAAAQKVTQVYRKVLGGN